MIIEAITGYKYIKDIGYGLIIISILGSFWYVVDDWHYKPLRDANKQLSEKKEIIKIYEGKITSLTNDVDRCEQETKRGRIHGIVEGIKAHEDDKNITFDYNSDKF